MNNMLWILAFILFFILTFRFRKIQKRLEECVEIARNRRYEKELIREWTETFPGIGVYEIDRIFSYYGLLSPSEFISILKKESEDWYNSIEQIRMLIRHFKRLLKHFKKLLWSSINRSNKNKSILEILRKQIKVIDDEELVFAF